MIHEKGEYLMSYSRNNIQLLLILLLLVFVIMIGFGADKVPSLWFDEGWTLVVARNWVEHGKYALNLDENFVSAAPKAHAFSLTIPVAINFLIFGVGIIQGRLANILFTVGVLALVFWLARKIYDSKTAWATIVVLLLLSPQVSINPLLFGRQVLGETPMLFYLLLGYVFFDRSMSRSRANIIFVGIFWGLALITKVQIIPFWLFSMIALIVFAAVIGRRREMKTLIAIFISVGFLFGFFALFQNWIVSDWPSNGSINFEDLYSISAWVWVPSVRIGSLVSVVRLGIFSVFGLAACSIGLLQRYKNINLNNNTIDWTQIFLLFLVSSWITWFALVSIGWSRYYYPIFILSALFYSRLLVDWTGEFKQWPTLKLLRTNKPGFWKSITAVALISINVGFVYYSFDYITTELDNELELVADYFNYEIEKGALIETYDSEVVFLLRQQIHYPPDNLQMELNRRTFLMQPIVISYDLDTVEPDYIIVGPRGNEWGLYDSIISSKEYPCVLKVDGYSVYKTKNQ
jgi:hypothetical protein